ncbi:MAG: hypothetical protein MJ211_10850 [Bacteroidales bacterium]|nr:hypothetical protein [Bacteroidales bacterium]
MKKYICFIISCALIFCTTNIFAQDCVKNSFTKEQQKLMKSDGIQPISISFLGGNSRNFYGFDLPDKLDTLWKIELGEGMSPAYGYDKIWKGAGWTGQPLIINEKGKTYLIQGAFDYSIRKIEAETGKVVWRTVFDDILKATGTFCVNRFAKDIENRYIIIQGSRKGFDKDSTSKLCTSLRAVSYMTGKILWQLNSIATDCYSRDVDASALMVGDTAYIPLENGLFTVFNINPDSAKIVDGVLQPQIYRQICLYDENDIKTRGTDLVPEASPTLLGNHIYIPCSTGWIHGYNIDKCCIDWKIFIGPDIDGTMPVTKDSCLLVAMEKQYIEGPSGIMKINPRKNPENAIEWFFPVADLHYSHWDGGVIGSVTISDSYKSKIKKNMAIFNDLEGYLYIVDYMNIDKDKKVVGPDNKTYYSTPKLLVKQQTYLTIATPITDGKKIAAPTDKGFYLFDIQKNKSDEIFLKQLDLIPTLPADATPSFYKKRLFVPTYDGNMVSLGRKK